MDFKKLRINILRLLIFVIFLFLLTLPLSYYINQNYSKTINMFYSEFNKCDFQNAKQTLDNNSLILKIKKKEMTSDISKYFTGIITSLCSELKKNNISSDQAISVFKEIKSYDILDDSLDKLILTLDEDSVLEDTSLYKSYLSLAIDKYNDGDLTGSAEMLNKIPSTQLDYYSTAQQYLDKCKEAYKQSLLSQADKLASDDYYTKAIDLLSNADSSLISSDDTDISSKIASIESARNNYMDSQYYVDNAQQTSSTLLENLNIDTINTLDISSNTSYLIYVNLNDQKTYVYKGSANNWSLERDFECSTGIQGQETPKGIYSITGRGDWFYADEYGQGGKYWVQFWGDYLFHSLPFDESQSTILDYTLGVPSSHGCIRLGVDNAKWLYDTMPDDTKVIIN